MNSNVKTKNDKFSVTDFAKFMVDAVLDKKAAEVTLLDLREVDEAICDYFLICEGGSPTQVKAIADNIQFRCKHELGEYASTIEGTSVAEWVLVDYFDIVVHVFLAEKRKFYNLEDLWGDAIQTRFDEFGKVIK